MKKKRKQKPQTKCWDCSIAQSSKCKWVLFGQPVEGWKAEDTEIKYQDAEAIKSKCVFKCPNFKEDKRNPKSDIYKELKPVRTSICLNCGKKLIGWKQFCCDRCNREYHRKEEKRLHPEKHCYICGNKLIKGGGVDTGLTDLKGNKKIAHKKCWNKKKKDGTS